MFRFSYNHLQALLDKTMYKMHFIHSFMKECKRLGFHSAFLNILCKDIFSWKGLKMIL